MLNGTGRLGDSGEDGEICYSSGCWDFWDLMNAAPITSAAPAVHQELIGTLAERTRIRRLRDQQQRRWDQPQPARSGAERRPAASHDEPDASTDLSVASLLPHTQSRSFGHAGLDGPPGPSYSGAADLGQAPPTEASGPARPGAAGPHGTPLTTCREGRHPRPKPYRAAEACQESFIESSGYLARYVTLRALRPRAAKRDGIQKAACRRVGPRPRRPGLARWRRAWPASGHSLTFSSPLAEG